MRIISGKARGTKLYTLDNTDITRPTLDRVKESMFNIINSQISNTIVLDLFAGCGAIGLEFASRGSKQVILCDNSREAMYIIERNIEKTHFKDIVITLNCDFKKALKSIHEEKIDIIFLDPPYKTDYIKQSLEIILKLDCIDKDTLIICETDDISRVIKEISDFNIKIIDQRKYGRANLIFLNKK